MQSYMRKYVQHLGSELKNEKLSLALEQPQPSRHHALLTHTHTHTVCPLNVWTC